VNRPILPPEAMATLRLSFLRHPWFRGLDLEGIGIDAKIIVRTSDLQEAQVKLDELGRRWSGYRLELRRVSS
jgi:hypothetical protein